MNLLTKHRSRVAGAATLGLCAVLAASFGVPVTFAQEALSVSVTPPLFQLTIGPGEYWASSLKVVNNNTRDVTYYSDLVNFEAEGEEGQGKFVPLVEEFDDPAQRTYSLASWIEMSSEPITVKKGQSAEIPFSVRVPEDAEPGGHYAAVLVGTQPGGALTDTGPSVKISSFVSSLLFVRIRGEVIEKGRIREFRSEKSLYETAHADFLLRFENIGNTHLKPQGDITIFNMWGKERGQVLINHKSNFGNVLPKSIRKFEFSWEGEHSPFDIGRYSAVVTLAYGDDSKQNISATTYFWVIPVVPVSVALGCLALFIALMTWFIRRYVRVALALEKERLGMHTSLSLPTHPVTYTLETLIEPLKEGVVDMRSIASAKAKVSVGAVLQPGSSVPAGTGIGPQASLTMFQFVKKYKLFFLFIGVLLVGCIAAWWYLDKVLVPARQYEITDVSIQEEASTTTEQIGSEE